MNTKTTNSGPLRDESPPSDALRDWGGPAEMSAFEAVMWLAEADPRMRSTVTCVLVLDRAPDWDRVVAGHERMVNAAPRLRQRVMEPALGAGLPQWVDDPDFMLDYHLRRQRLPQAGTDRQLLDLAQNLAMTPFDRVRPPWEGTLVEGLEGDRAAYIFKLHHVLSDGIGIVQLLSHAMSTTRTSRGLAAGSAAHGRRAVSPARLAAANLGQGMRRWPAAGAGSFATAVASITGLLRKPDGLKQAWDYIGSAGRVLKGQTARGSPILRQRSRNWRFDTLQVPLPELKAAARAAQASLNDVFLAGLVGGFHRYHAAMGVKLGQMPIAFPISLRAEGDAAGGNRFTGAHYAAPVAEPDPLARIAHVRQFVRQARQEPALDIVLRLSPLMARMPGAVLGALAGRMTKTQDAQISNVPGFSQTMYLAGAKVLQIWPLGPAPGCAVMIGMLTYDGTCGIGLTSDRAAVTEPELLAQCLLEGLNEVIALASVQPDPARNVPARRRRDAARKGAPASLRRSH